MAGLPAPRPHLHRLAAGLLRRSQRPGDANGDDTVELTDPDNDHIYTGTFSIAVGGRMSGNVRICVTCNLIRRCTDGQVTIDPEGTVFDVTKAGSPSTPPW
ncbi:MAG: hypothetical protein R2856_38820 [Caldilineaceae bacterium]